MKHRNATARMVCAGMAAVILGLTGSVSFFSGIAFSNPGNSHANTHKTQGNAGTSGSPTSPQPPSNADMNGHGANKSGPYNSTRNGAPSLNGNGGGQATGKPCAGCVGKADNKNPPGQLAVGSAGSGISNGFECNGNHGIGRTNPAHTGCRTTATTMPPPTSVPPTSVPKPPPKPPTPPPPHAHEVSLVQAVPATIAAAASTAVHAVTQLPVTGINLGVLLLAGFGAILLGAVAVRTSRRRAPASAETT